MERSRLIKLIDNRGASSKEETNELWEIVRTFPYFQTARLLLAKSFHDQNSIHFHNELKVAAAYAADRKALHNLIHQPKETAKAVIAEPEPNVFALEREEQPEVQKETESQFVIPDTGADNKPLFEIGEVPVAIEDHGTVKEEFIPPVIHQEKKEETVEEKPYTSFAPIYDEPATTNEEIIRRRLNEILSRNKAPEPQAITDEPAAIPLSVEEPEAEVIENVEEPIAPIEEEVIAPPVALEELPAQPHDEIEGLGLETIIEENYLKELEKLPEIAIPVPPEAEEKTSTDDSPVSFIDWLKSKNQSPTTVEEVTDEADVTFSKEVMQEKTAVQIPPFGGGGAADLINKFIVDKPRIVPSKAEFYNPSNMARLSIMDNEDIISETLARIYYDQQNYAKARSLYAKLSLLYPEKSASFAPLIQKIDNILKDQS